VIRLDRELRLRWRRSLWLVPLMISSLVTCPGVTAMAAEGPLAFGGSLRNITAGIDNYYYPLFFGDAGTDGLSQSILRLTAEGRPKTWLSYEVHLVQGFDISTGGGGSGTSVFDIGPRLSRYQAVNGVHRWLRGYGTMAALWVDRLNVKVSLGGADLTVGRQAITFGKTYFWNALDVFLAFDPRQFDRDYKQGVDAARLDVATGDFSGMTLVVAPGAGFDAFGRRVYGGMGRWIASWYGSALLARCFATLSGWDVAFQGGKVYGGYQLGGGVVGEVGPLEVRCEAAYLFAMEGPAMPYGLGGDLVEDNLVAVFGLGHRFENTLQVDGEYLYNGPGEPGNLDAAFVRFNSGDSFHLGRHLLGLLGSYEIIPILTGRLGGLLSLSDGSGQIQPSLTYSASDEVDLLFGGLVNFGGRPEFDPNAVYGLSSEFGTFPDVYYGEFKVYF